VPFPPNHTPISVDTSPFYERVALAIYHLPQGLSIVQRHAYRGEFITGELCRIVLKRPRKARLVPDPQHYLH
jgi:hypothetical protein